MTRIVAGRAGGRSLAVPPRGTRPTSDRVREALFSRLEHLDVLDGARVVDLFAGSGALGLEAASRGAADVVLVESAGRAVAVCRRNVSELGLPGVRVAAERVRTWLQRGPTGAGGAPVIDLALVDPPYDLPEEELAGVLADLAGWLDPQGVVVVERSARSPEPPWPTGLARFDDRRYGETALWFAEPVPREGAPAPPGHLAP
ncbi:16S rRNA (guanine(966)-N(2))-methyltransferase RsmD [Isoptericola sp. b441]|uniref:16S rRNA (Guanine(966)-N(2))-methyltransferase RsmD n=1 Tax=Actinotalea lenta TaxID=3064654 RepID=A0ABT9DBA9_9CELL|nr:16S rRNA (guanine(966)-N(2))-methyltransferase RsmD [Isoptericola sp. b441]MDO8108165.1 16S rRNA (guanine(966)-N(2))-methyltransferase RsmD [Isoptericola sp. b441]